MKDEKSPAGRDDRRVFLMGLLTGAGVVSALVGGRRQEAGAQPQKAAPEPAAGPAEPILYRRTAETERYYRTLYR